MMENSGSLLCYRWHRVSEIKTYFLGKVILELCGSGIKAESQCTVAHIGTYDNLLGVLSKIF